jgi:hypothetical protein
MFKWVNSNNRIIPVKAVNSKAVRSPTSRRRIQGKAASRAVRNPGKAVNMVANKAAKTADLGVRRSEFPLIFA